MDARRATTISPSHTVFRSNSDPATNTSWPSPDCDAMYSPTTEPISAKPMFTRRVEKIHGKALGKISFEKIKLGFALNERKRFSKSLSTSRAAAHEEIIATANVEIPESQTFEVISEPNQI